MEEGKGEGMVNGRGERGGDGKWKRERGKDSKWKRESGGDEG